VHINNARAIVDALKAAGIDYVAYLPDSFFFDVLQAIREDPDLMSISVCNESTGLCMCAGAWLGGKTPVMIMENSGILVSAYAVTRLLHAFGIPILILSSWRGDAGDSFWWSSAFTRVNEPVLRGLAIPFVFVADADAARAAIIDSQTSLSVSDEPRAVIFTGVGKW
jgi:sulfopyruvate decarboxylase subunit alpha